MTEGFTEGDVLEAMSWERIVFDVGKDEVKLRQIQGSLDFFGNDATLFYYWDL